MFFLPRLFHTLRILIPVLAPLQLLIVLCPFRNASLLFSSSSSSFPLLSSSSSSSSYSSYISPCLPDVIFLPLALHPSLHAFFLILILLFLAYSLISLSSSDADLGANVLKRGARPSPIGRWVSQLADTLLGRHTGHQEDDEPRLQVSTFCTNPSTVVFHEKAFHY